MAQTRLTALPIVVVFGLLLTTGVTGEMSPPPLDQKARNIVQAAYDFVSEHSGDMKAVQHALENDPRFRDDANELYIFMHVYNVERREAICVGQGIKPELIGKNMWSLRTPNGRLIFQEFARLIQVHEEFWLEYEWLNPYTRTIETKRSYFKRIVLPDGSSAWIGCGFWKHGATSTTAPASHVQEESPFVDTVEAPLGDQAVDSKTVRGQHDVNPRFRNDCADSDAALPPLAQEAKAIVEAAHAFVSEHAHDMAIVQNALENDPRFRDDANQLYIFMHAYDIEQREAVCIGHGMRPDLLGKNMWSLRTPNGRLLFQEEIELIEEHDEFWLEYEWLNPHTNTIETKCSLFKRIVLPSAPNAWIGCGFWKR